MPPSAIVRVALVQFLQQPEHRDIPYRFRTPILAEPIMSGKAQTTEFLKIPVCNSLCVCLQRKCGSDFILRKRACSVADSLLPSEGERQAIICCRRALLAVSGKPLQKQVKRPSKNGWYQQYRKLLKIRRREGQPSAHFFAAERKIPRCGLTQQMKAAKILCSLRSSSRHLAALKVHLRISGGSSGAPLSLLTLPLFSTSAVDRGQLPSLRTGAERVIFSAQLSTVSRRYTPVHSRLWAEAVRAGSVIPGRSGRVMSPRKI